MEAIVAVGAIATSRLLRRPCSAIAARTAAHRSTWVTGTSQWSGCSTPLAARVAAYAGCGPCSRASAQLTSSAVRYTSSLIRVDSSTASGESKGRPSAKNTSCRPISPSPTGRQRGLDRADSSLG